MTTLITGGTRLIGAVLAEMLLRRGERVVLLDAAPVEWRIRHLTATPGRPDVMRGDVTSLVDLLDAIRIHGVTALVHLAYVLGAESNASTPIEVGVREHLAVARQRAGVAA